MLAGSKRFESASSLRGIECVMRGLIDETIHNRITDRNEPSADWAGLPAQTSTRRPAIANMSRACSRASARSDRTMGDGMCLRFGHPTPRQ